MSPTEALSKLHLLSGLPEGEIARLERNARLVHLNRNEALFHAGDTTESFYGVHEGRLRLAFPDAGNAHDVNRTLTVIREGEMFCDAIAFLNTPHPVNAIADTDSQVLRIARDAVLDLVRRNCDFALRMLLHLSRSKSWLVNEIRDLKLSSASKRLACYLLHFAPKVESNRYELTLPMQKQVVAARLNISPAHFSRDLQQLAQAEIIEVHGRTISVLDAARLKALV